MLPRSDASLSTGRGAQRVKALLLDAYDKAGPVFASGLSVFPRLENTLPSPIDTFFFFRHVNIVKLVTVMVLLA